MNPVRFFRRERERQVAGKAETCQRQDSISEQNTGQEGEAERLLFFEILLHGYAVQMHKNSLTMLDKSCKISVAF